MYERLYSPNIVASGSSLVGEDSLSVSCQQDEMSSKSSHLTLQHHVDYSIGVYIIDRYTYYTLQFLEQNVNKRTNHTLQEYVSAFVMFLSHYFATVGLVPAQQVPLDSRQSPRSLPKTAEACACHRLLRQPTTCARAAANCIGSDGQSVTVPYTGHRCVAISLNRSPMLYCAVNEAVFWRFIGCS